MHGSVADPVLDDARARARGRWGRHAALRPIVERVAALDGTMDVETTPGWGTTLPIEIPLDPPSATLTVEGAEELTDREKQGTARVPPCSGFADRPQAFPAWVRPPRRLDSSISVSERAS